MAGGLFISIVTDGRNRIIKMNCPKCGNQQADDNAVCSHCGIVFEKFYKYNPSTDHGNQSTNQGDARGQVPVVADISCTIESPPELKQRLLSTGEEDIFFVSARGLVFLGMLILSYRLISSSIASNYVGQIFLHNVNLVFHEAGHIVFRLFGQFISSLGGSLGQLIIPAICFYTFLFRHNNPFAAAVCFWWIGENLIDMAPYMNDARTGELPLLGGNFGHSSPYGFHDWEYLLTESGLLNYDRFIARLSFFTGSLMMILALAWGGILLHLQYKAATKR